MTAQPAGAGFAHETLEGFLDRLASHTPAPGGGAAAAVSAGLAAGLVAMAAHFSGVHLADAAGLVSGADRLRSRALRLAAEDAEAYRAVLDAYRLANDRPDRSERITEALERAADVPLAIAAVGAGIAAMGAALAADGNPNLHGDAVIAVILADAAARGAARLVELNVALGGLEGHWRDELSGHLRHCAAARATIEDR